MDGEVSASGEDVPNSNRLAEYLRARRVQPEGVSLPPGGRRRVQGVVELLIATVHRIGARAERRVTEELINAFKR